MWSPQSCFPQPLRLKKPTSSSLPGHSVTCIVSVPSDTVSCLSPPLKSKLCESYGPHHLEQCLNEWIQAFSWRVLKLEVFTVRDMLFRENGFLNEEKYICRYKESVRWPSGPIGILNSILVDNIRESFLGNILKLYFIGSCLR